MINVNGSTIEWTCWHCGLGFVWDKKYPGLYRRPRIVEDEDGAKRIICPYCGRTSKDGAELFDDGDVATDTEVGGDR